MFWETKFCPKLFHFHQSQPDQSLGANAVAVAYQKAKYKNSGQVGILHCWNSFPHTNYVAFSLLYVSAYMYCLRKHRLFFLISQWLQSRMQSVTWAPDDRMVSQKSKVQLAPPLKHFCEI